jgi:hypothetical protein
MTDVAKWNPTISQQLAELRRELVMRRQVFPKWVAAKKLNQRDMDYRIACIEATIKLLERLGERTQG